MIKNYISGNMDDESADNFTRKCFGMLWHCPPLSTSEGLVMSANFNSFMATQMLKGYNIPDAVAEVYVSN